MITITIISFPYLWSYLSSKGNPPPPPPPLTKVTLVLQVYLTTGLFIIVSWISFIVPPEVVPGLISTWFIRTLI